LASEDNDELPVAELIDKTVARFIERILPIADRIRQMGGSAEVFVVLSILSERIPGIEFSHSFLGLLSRLNCTFQIDLQGH
jgi:hypothetical protein